MQAEVELKTIDVEMLLAQIEQSQLLTPFAGVARYTDGERSEVLSGLVENEQVYERWTL